MPFFAPSFTYLTEYSWVFVAEDERETRPGRSWSNIMAHDLFVQVYKILYECWRLHVCRIMENGHVGCRLLQGEKKRLLYMSDVIVRAWV